MEHWIGNFVIANTHLLLNTKPVKFCKTIVKEDITGVLHSKNNFYFTTNEANSVHMVLNESLA